MEGITVRRPRIVTGAAANSNMMRIESGGRLDMFHCIFDNGNAGPCISVAGNAGGEWEKVSVAGSRGRSGLRLAPNAKVKLVDVSGCYRAECVGSMYALPSILSRDILVRCW